MSDKNILTKKGKEKMMEKEILVDLRNVWKIYGKTIALAGVTLQIERNEFVAIMGPSGAGKSTLLRIIGLLESPDRGKIFLFGKDCSLLLEHDKDRIRREKIGFIFQQFLLIPYLTVLDNVALPITIRGIPLRSARKKAVKLLESVGLEKHLNKFPTQLSGGEQQRVAIARALANDPEIILADEPTGNLDSKTGEKILRIFKKLYKSGKTIVVVTHDNSVATSAERIIKMKDGRIVV